MYRALKFAVLAAGFSVLVGVMGGLIAAPEDRAAIWTGIAMAYGVQLVLFVTLFVWRFASQPMLAHGLSMVARLAVLGTVALIGVPWADLPAAPFLFSLVAVFFVTTLLEPLFLIRFSPAR
ncbi:MAG: hypothetical protein WD737_13235 [Gemmatimonadota bacterium]